MKLKTIVLLARAKRSAEKELGKKVPIGVAREILDYCIVKNAHIKKGEDYLPLLYRCELPLQYEMREITRFSLEMMKMRKEVDETDVFRMQTNTV